MHTEWLTQAESVFEEISRAQDEAVAGFAPETKAVDGLASPEGGKPLLGLQDIGIDGARVRRLLTEVLGIIQQWVGGDDIVAAGTSELSDADITALLGATIKSASELAELACEHAERPELFACGIRYALGPFVKAHASRLESRLDHEAGSTNGRCPVCGAEPFMAEFDKEDGRRRLACSLCGTRWRFARMRCPFCGNEDHEKLGYLEVDGFEGYRVDVCESCKRYLKTLDRKKRVRPSALELADVLTPELDEAAIEKGYGLRTPSSSQ